MLAYARALGVTYYAQNYASIIELIRHPLGPTHVAHVHFDTCQKFCMGAKEDGVEIPVGENGSLISGASGLKYW